MVCEHSGVFTCRSKLFCCREQRCWPVLQQFLLLIKPLFPPVLAKCFDLRPAKHKTRAMQGVIYYDKMHNFTPHFALTIVMCRQFFHKENELILLYFFFFSRRTGEAVTSTLNKHIMCKEIIL